MRSLKFKAWDRKLKIWCSTEPFHLIGEWTVFDCLNQYIESDFIKRLNDIEIVQSLDHEDKNEREIYEHDIVKYEGSIWLVGYCNNCCGYELYEYEDETGTTCLDINWYEVEIIGNKYENDFELLKKQNEENNV